MARKNKKGQTWKQHTAKYLRKALKEAAKTWMPASLRVNMARVQKLRKMREKINADIKKELNKS